MNRLQSILANPHTTWAGITAALLQIAQIWAPSGYDQKLDKTTAIVLSYAAIMAGDARKREEHTVIVSDPSEAPTKTE